MTDEEKKDDSYFIPHPSSLIRKFRRVLRGDVKVNTVAREVLRRGLVTLQQKHERASLNQLDKRPARLNRDFAKLTTAALLDHFRERSTPKFLPGFDVPSIEVADLQRSVFPVETARLIESAQRIVHEHRWTLLGYDERDFGDPIEWRRDIVSGELWPLEYHVDVNLAREGSDVRVLWELNRLSHLIMLGRAYTLTQDEQLAETFFEHLESWRCQNPVGQGPNWACAMEVALRSMNLLAAFQLFRSSPSLNDARLLQLLVMFEAHGAHIRRNSEFSYLATSNHYLSDVVGLYWLGTMLPELKAAKQWREFGRREMLREMDTQILDDGADFEASTGYHRFVLELFLYSFILSSANDGEIPERYWRKLHAMLNYLHAYLRPDGRAPLIGDTDSGQVIPIVKRDADDHAYVLIVGASFLKDSQFKKKWNSAITEELLWILGAQGVQEYQALPATRDADTSTAFVDAGTYLMRDSDLYLLFNTSGNGVKGRGSHGHNDLLSIEVSACGTSFIVDPGTYVYRTDLEERNRFRSTAYHSTVQVDDVEQNTINRDLPFVVGDEAHTHVLACEMNAERDLVIGEHDGYARLNQPVTHRRSVEFNKRGRFWVIEDALLGAGEHVFDFRFHLANDVEASVSSKGIVTVTSGETAARLLIVPLDVNQLPELEPRWTSRDYGAKMASVSVFWTLRASAPLYRRWAIVPVCANEDETERTNLIEALRISERSY
jgi:hypothetical protein